MKNDDTERLSLTSKVKFKLMYVHPPLILDQKICEKFRQNKIQ